MIPVNTRLDYKSAAAYLGLSEFTLRRYVSLGFIPYLKLGPKLVRFNIQDLEKWLESRKVKPKVRS